MTATKKSLFIISSLFEPNVNHVVRRLDERGMPWFRFNTETFPLLCQGRIQFFDDGGPQFELTIDGHSIHSRDIAAVWYRRQSDPVLAENLRPQDQEFVRLECLSYLNALFRCLDHCRWVNPWLAERLAANKPGQLALAKSLGLAIPRTVVTNDPKTVRDFYQQCAGRVVFKPLLGLVTGKPPDYSSQLKSAFEGKFVFPPRCEQESTEKDRRILFTQLLTDDKLDQIDSLAACPAIFQQYVDKQVELRITIVGNQVFSAAIDSQEHPETRVDFRRLALLPSTKAVRHTVFDLPPEVHKKLLSLMAKLGLRFGCVDMILTPQQEYVFLEVNPSGQWAWIEDKTGMPITSALVDLLLAGESTSNPVPKSPGI
jgi:glutathione synthase/RimK-type ligase-like ATP-grasp enzyme